MKRYVLYAAVLILCLLVPINGTDVARLRPVETVMLYAQGSKIIIRTDTKDFGVGKDSLSAFEDLKATTPGIIYLDTADFLLVAEDALDGIEPLRKYLKKDVQLFRFAGEVDPAEASRYLSIHGNGPKLKNWKTGQTLPLVATEEKRLILS